MVEQTIEIQADDIPIVEAEIRLLERKKIQLV